MAGAPVVSRAEDLDRALRRVSYAKAAYGELEDRLRGAAINLDSALFAAFVVWSKTVPWAVVDMGVLVAVPQAGDPFLDMLSKLEQSVHVWDGRNGEAVRAVYREENVYGGAATVDVGPVMPDGSDWSVEDTVEYAVAHKMGQPTVANLSELRSLLERARAG